MVDNKTIFRYDARGKSFKRVALFLIALAFILAVFGIFWISTLLKQEIK